MEDLGDYYEDLPVEEPEGRYSEEEENSGLDIDVDPTLGGCGCENGCTCSKCGGSNTMKLIILALVVIAIIVIVCNCSSSTENATSGCGDAAPESANLEPTVLEAKKKEIGFMQRIGNTLRGY